MNVIIPIHDRPEFAARCFRSVARADKQYDGKVNVFIYGDDGPECPEVVNLSLEIMGHMNIDHHIWPDKKGHTAMASAMIHHTTRRDGPFILLESDIEVSSSYFQYMNELYSRHGDDDRYYEIHADRRHHAVDVSDPYKYCENRWISTLGPMLFPDRMNLFFDHIGWFFEDPEGLYEHFESQIPKSLRPSMIKPSGEFFNHAWGGLMLIDMLVNDRTTLMPWTDSQVAHLGWYGYNSNREMQERQGVTRPEDDQHWPRFFSRDMADFDPSKMVKR